MCMLQTTDGLRNHRKLTLKELAELHTEREQVAEYLSVDEGSRVVHRIRKFGGP